MTPTGVALLLAGLYFLAARPHRLMPALVFFASFSGTSVFNTASFGISPGVLFLVLFLLWGCISGRLARPVAVDPNHPALMLCLGAFAAYALGTLLLDGAAGARGQGLAQLQLTQLVYLVVGVVITAVLSLEMSRPRSLDRAVRALRAGACFVAGWGVVQAACFYGGVAYPAFLFNNSTSHFADMFDQRAGEGVIRIASVAVEPSFMASSLMIFGAFGATLAVCEPRLRVRGWVVPTGMALAVVAASTSTTGFLGLAVLGLLLALRRPGAVLLAGLGALVAAGVALVLLPGFREAIYGVTFGKTASSSFSDRAASLGHAMALFAAQPWLGAGWGSDFSYSILTSLPANVGVVGTALFAATFGATLLASRAARHRDDGAARHRDDGAARHRDDGAARHRDDGAARHRNDGAARHRNDGAARHRSDGVARRDFGGAGWGDGAARVEPAAAPEEQGCEPWRLRAYAMAAENAMLVYMAQAAASGFKYVVPDIWVLWALCLAIPSNLARVRARSDRAADGARRTAFGAMPAGLIGLETRGDTPGGVSRGF